MIKRKLTLEQRIARLERAIKNESLETALDIDAARAAAVSMADEFKSLTGIALRLDMQHEIIDSPIYGWTNDVADLEEDPDAKFTFKFDFVADPNVSAYMIPSDNKVVVWSSLDEDGCEGAVDPRTGMCEWCDELSECAYPMKAWRRFNLNMIHSDEYDESRVRRLGKRRCR